MICHDIALVSHGVWTVNPTFAVKEDVAGRT